MARGRRVARGPPGGGRGARPAGGRSRGSRRVNDSQADSLGLSSSALPLLRDLIHERTGVFFDNGRYDVLRDRLAPLVVERGFDSFLDYYYLLKYDEGAAEDWGRVIDALAVPETYFWREMDQIRGVVTCARARAGEGAAVRAAADLERAVGERRGAADDRDAARGGRLVRSRADRDPRQRRQPGGDRAGPRRPLSRALVPRAAAGAAREVLPGGGRRMDGRPPRSSAGSRRGASSTCSTTRRWRRGRGVPIVFCRNVFIYFSEAAIRRGGRSLRRARCRRPRISASGASESLLRVTSRFDLEELGGGFVYVKRR